MRVVFMGTPEFSVPVLEAVASEHEVVCVYSQPPRPAGRGKKLRASPVQARGEALGLPVRHPTTLRTVEAQAEFASLNADVAVVVAYGLILPQPVLDAPRLECINVHASLLPRWRGAAPIHRAIMAGDAKTGICIMKMEAGLDTGPVLMREATEIGPEETTGDLHDRLSEMGARLTLRVLPQLEHLSPVAQSEDGVTYASKIEKSEGAVNWDQPAKTIVRQINGLSPFPGAFVMRDESRIKVLRARRVDGTAPAGVVADGPGLQIGTTDGLVDVLELQPAGRGAMSAEDWRRGAQVVAGEVFARDSEA